ncbi:MAG TPA: lysoplasmalogenase [Chloroflexia bacterium]|nr:lysoplasmalogenase [Chloroflexia bacterium]
MFSALQNSFQNLWLTALLAAWAGLLFGGFIFGRPDSENFRRMPGWTRLLSSLALVMAAWSWFIFLRETPLELYTLLIALGMTLGFAGDLFMAANIVLGGIGSFGLGHVAYILAMLQYENDRALVATTPRFGAWSIWVAIGLAGWYLAVFRGQKSGVLHWAALPYATLLASTAGVATGLALQDGAFWSLAVGGALFLLSDLLIAANLFNGLRFRLLGDLIWLTYGPAQALIVFTTYFAMQ